MTTSSNSSRTSPSTQAPSWRSGAIAASRSSMPKPAFPSHAYAPSDATISTKSSTGRCGTNDGRRSDPLDARRYLPNRPCASSRKPRSFGPPSETGAQKWAKSSLGSERHDETTAAQLLAFVRPPRHHPDSLVPEVSASVGAADAVGVDMRQLTLDRIRVPKAAFVQNGRGGRTEAVRRHLVLFEAEPSKRRIDCVLAHATS